MTTQGSGRIVVTGGAGFIGQYVIERLIASGMPVHAVVFGGDDERRLRSSQHSVNMTAIADARDLGRAVRDLDPLHVIHLGAVIDNRPSIDAFQKTLSGNLLSTLSLMEALIECSAQRVILLGSCEEYGHNPIPFQTSTAVDPMTPYAASKAASAAYARMFHHVFGLPVVVLRPAVIYGYGQNPRMLISDVMNALEEGRTVDVSHGEQERDFLYVTDVVSAIERAIDAPGIEGCVLNVGTGCTVTVRCCVEEIVRLTGRHDLVRWGTRPYAKNEVFKYVPDCSQTEALLGWKAKVGLPEGLAFMLAQTRAMRSENDLKGTRINT